ncbi:MAG: hypothetical protein KBI07_06435 [Candidatus Atribacteria bacterium]|nr:hypothetical protein [Candidatus Atribacteria bacterium]
MFFSLKNFKCSNYSNLIFVIIVTLSILPFAFCSIPSLAQGGGGNNSLILVGHRLVDELSEDGTRTTQIELVFSKNVVNLAVSENNKTCFKVLSKDDGMEIPVQVQMADDQIEREKRNIITLVIEKPLEPWKAYQIIISPELESKSGEKLEKELVLEFVTLGEVK